MSIDTKTEQLIILLTRETYAGNIKWRNVKPPMGLTHATENFYPLYLETNYKNTKIGLYQRRYRHFIDVDEFVWLEDCGICVVDDVNNTVIWNEEISSAALYNLFDAARQDASNISGILDSLLQSQD